MATEKSYHDPLKINDIDRLFHFIRRNGYDQSQIAKRVRVNPEFLRNLRWEAGEALNCFLKNEEVSETILRLWGAMNCLECYQMCTEAEIFSSRAIDYQNLMESVLTCISGCVIAGRSLNVDSTESEPEEKLLEAERIGRKFRDAGIQHIACQTEGKRFVVALQTGLENIRTSGVEGYITDPFHEIYR